MCLNYANHVARYKYYLSGKQVRKNLHTSSKRMAEEKMRMVESALFRDEDIPLPTRTPLAAILGEYVDYLRLTKKRNNANKIIQYLREAFGPLCPGLEVQNPKISRKAQIYPEREERVRLEVPFLEQLTTADVARCRDNYLKSKGVSNNTANHLRQVVVRFINWAMTERGVRFPGGINPAAKVPMLDVERTEIIFLDLEEIEEQLEELKGYPQLRVMVAVLIFAGLRREEVLWLRTGDIDLTAGRYGMVRVYTKSDVSKGSNGLQPSSGKATRLDRKQSRRQARSQKKAKKDSWQPKTSDHRAIPVSRRLREILASYAPPPSDGNWFFPSPHGTRWDQDNFSRDLAAANAENGLPWTCLDYRHTFGSQLAMKGESLQKISALMGNSPEICHRHYVHLMPASMADSVEFPEPGSSPAGPAADDPSQQSPTGRGGDCDCLPQDESDRPKRPQLRLVHSR
ncbi:tyrosine-type recombinase/integrase [Geobacter pelophilus]|uniref:Tyrosine-type recombinase/integrase n=1 Tax=Geoanaerobacter pelophilus TaxID=60036 RepID=A0AAW4LEJ5_9BACT|nr:tyrosine-type recombinase/integrase [Geoanaerobacter pelophilus]MBT0666429.1 tyrosine-type recombinase/integrase [Geoanaerobacter pelophilus]